MFFTLDPTCLAGRPFSMFKVILWEQLLRSERLDWISLKLSAVSLLPVFTNAESWVWRTHLRNLNICGFCIHGGSILDTKGWLYFQITPKPWLHPAIAHCYSQLPWIKWQVFSYNVFQLFFLCTEIKLMSPWLIAYTSPSFQLPRGGQCDTTIWRA